MAKRLKDESKEEKKKFGISKIILLIIFILMFIFASVNLIRWVIYNNKSKAVIAEVLETTVVNDFDVEKNEEEKPQNPIEFDSLKEINSDAVAWIRIKDTSVNYPILKTDNNDYYLHKDIYKEYSTCGWIFMDYKNNSEFIDKNTVIYGHNIKSGIMFADLMKVKNNKLGKDIIIEIYTPKEKLEYKVFSSYVIEPEDYAIKSNIVTEDAMESYIKTMLDRSTILYNIVPSKLDRVITLSTCDNSGDNRVLIHGVYVGGEKYEE